MSKKTLLICPIRCIIEEEKLRCTGSENPRDAEIRSLAHYLRPFLNICGLTDVDQQVYLEPEGGKPGPPRLPELLFLVVISTLSKLHLSSKIGE